MGAFAAPTIVDGAPRTQRPFGLSSVVDFATSGGEEDGSSRRPDRWLNGVQWDELTCAPVSGIGDQQCVVANTVGLPKSFADGHGFGTASAFTVYGSYKCAPLGRHDVFEYAQDMATKHLESREQQRVEQALFFGDLGNTPSIVPGATNLSASGAVAPDVALGALEQFIADNYGSQGVIHLGISAAAILNRYHLVTQGDKLETWDGTPVVVGTGYRNVAPGNVPAGAGDYWAYITPAIFGFKGEVFTAVNQVGSLLDRNRNDLYAVAERTYLLGFDNCGVGAVRFTV